MKSILFTVLAVVVTLAFAKQPPQWPNQVRNCYLLNPSVYLQFLQYYVKGVFSLPYWDLVEPIGTVLSSLISTYKTQEFWYDGTNNRELISYYDGMDVYNWRFDTVCVFWCIYLIYFAANFVPSYPTY